MLVWFSAVTVLLLCAAGSVTSNITNSSEIFSSVTAQERFLSMTKDRDEWCFPCLKIVSKLSASTGSRYMCTGG